MSITRYGGPEVIDEVILPEPQPGPGEVTIDVTHASVGLVEGIIRRGVYAAREGVVKPPFIPGLEVAGTIRALGEGVSGLRVGEHVTTLTLSHQGGYAEIAVAPAHLTVSIEDTGVTAVQAVAGLANAATAYLALTEVGHFRKGEKLLVHGVIGGLASAFPAVARLLGASRVVGTVRSADKADAALALGLDVVDTNHIWVSNIAVLGFNVGGLLAAEPERGVPAGVAVLPPLADGRLVLPVTELPLAEAAEAHRRMDAKEVTGRLILTV